MFEYLVLGGAVLVMVGLVLLLHAPARRSVSQTHASEGTDASPPQPTDLAR